MWKYICGVPKVVEEKKKERNLKAASDFKGPSKEYENNRTRMFSAEWQVGRPGLHHDHDKGMIYEWCIENRQTFGREKTNPGECILSVTCPNGECSQN